MLPGGQFSKKAAGRSRRRLAQGTHGGGERRGKGMRDHLGGPSRGPGARGVPKGCWETIEAAPEAGRSFSEEFAHAGIYFYTPPRTTLPPWRS